MTKTFSEIAPRVFLISADTSEELARLFVRFQEYYESPRFKGEVFTLEEFESWYQESRGASTFTYYDDWSGFNIPGWVIEDFAIKFHYLSKDEEWLVNKVWDAMVDNSPYYVIGAAKGEQDTFQHEIAHALFYLNNDYKAKVTAILDANTALLAPLGQHLRDMGYGESVIEDEKHAYLLTERRYMNSLGLWLEEFKSLNSQIYQIFKEAQ